MSELSGSLEDFPLPDVMRLLARGRKDGVLHVYGDTSRGRVYLDEGRISYATTRASDDFAEGDGAEGANGAHDRRRTKLIDVADDDPTRFMEYLESQIVEVLVRLGRESSGSFVFQNGVRPTEPVKEPFPIDGLLARAEGELKEWHRIEDIIHSTATPLTLNGSMAADHQITIDGLAWNAIACLAGQASSRDIAKELGEFEIVAARTMARLVEQGLVTVLQAPQAPQPPPVSEEPPPPDDFLVPKQPEPELSASETREVLSALSSKDIDRPVARAETPTDEPPVVDDGDLEQPSSELARRWRTLRSATN